MLQLIYWPTTLGIQQINVVHVLCTCDQEILHSYCYSYKITFRHLLYRFESRLLTLTWTQFTNFICLVFFLDGEILVSTNQRLNIAVNTAKRSSSLFVSGLKIQKVNKKMLTTNIKKYVKKRVQCVQIRLQLLSIITIYQNKLYFK